MTTNNPTSPREELARLLCRQHYGDRGYSLPAIARVVESDWEGWTDKADEVLAILSRHPVKAASPEGEAKTLDEAKQDCWSELCEVDDRNSPEEYPDMCLITQEELFAFMDAAAEASTPPTSERAEVVAEPVGEAGSMPGTAGFTMAVFKASDVPVGTKLYAAPPKPPKADQFAQNAKCSEAVAEEPDLLEIRERHMDGIDAARRVHDWIDTVAKADEGQVVSREKRVLSFTEDDGGAVLYMRDNRVAAAGMIVRDLHNFSIAMRMFEPTAALTTSTKGEG